MQKNYVNTAATLLLLVFLLLDCAMLTSAFLEVFANPEGHDNNKEFIELMWTDEVASLLENTTAGSTVLNYTFVVSDAASNDTAEHLVTLGLRESNTTYLLFVEEGYSYLAINESALNESNITCHLYSLGATIGNNLGNTQDNITITANSTVLVNTSYTAACEDCSLYYSAGNWTSQEPTPCLPKIVANESGDNSSDSTTCKFSFNITSDTLHEQGETIEYRPVVRGPQENLSITYWWEDLHGEVIKEARETKNTNTKRYTPSEKGEEDYAYIIRMRAKHACNSTSFDAQKLVVIKAEPEPLECPTITCESTRSSSSGSSSLSAVTTRDDPPVLALVAPQKAKGPFTITLTLYNDQPIKTDYKISTYVYIASRNYTPRDIIETISVPSRSERSVEIALHPDIEEEKEYSLKAQAYRSGRKTPYEERTTMVLVPLQEIIVDAANETVAASAENEMTHSETATSGDDQTNTITASVIGPEEKTRSWLPVILALGLWLGALLIRRIGAAVARKRQSPEEDPEA